MKVTLQQLKSDPQSEFSIFLDRPVVYVHLQVILSLEGFRALVARVFPLVAVCQLVLSQSTRVVEQLIADWTAND